MPVLVILFLLILLLVLTKNQHIQTGVLIFIVTFFYGHYFHTKTNQQRVSPVFYEKEVQIEGMVKNYAQENKNFRNHIEIIKINNQKTQGKILLEHKNTPLLLPGQTIKFTGKIKPIKNHKSFDYKRYLRQFQISGIVRLPQKIEIINSSNPIFQPSQKLRQTFEKNIKTKLPEPHSIIALGMTIGAKESLDNTTSNAIKNSGLQHLIVVSGSNVSFLICFVVICCKRLGPYLTGVISSLIIIFFWLLVGPDPPINRAVILGVVTSFCLLIGRRGESRNLLLLAALFMAVLNPLILTHSVSFWLSFTSTLGIILLSPIIFKYLHSYTNTHLSLLISATFSAQISVLPIIMITFGNFPASGFITNLLVEPLVPLIMINTAALNLFHSTPLLGEILTFIDFWCINLLLMIAQTFKNLGIINLPLVITYTGLGMQIVFFFWTQFSHYYERHFLMPFFSKLDFSSNPKKIENT